jgi:hypothetical protein
MSIFEQAAAMKLRYPYRGAATTEDLFDLSREQLSLVHEALTADLGTAGESLIKRRASVESHAAELRVAIVKYVFELKTAEALAARNATDRRANNQRIMAIIAEKQDGALQDKTIEELKALLAV